MDTDQKQIAAKEAYVLFQQLSDLESSMLKAGGNCAGYKACATTFNHILSRAREIVATDDIIKRSIAHLESSPVFYDSRSELSLFEEVKIRAAVLKAALRSFFELNYPPKEKAALGFGSARE